MPASAARRKRMRGFQPLNGFGSETVLPAAASAPAEPSANAGAGRVMIAMLGAWTDVERDLICTCTAQGSSRARTHGHHIGRPANLTDAQKAEARRGRAEGATLCELARSYHVGKSTISRLT